MSSFLLLWEARSNKSAGKKLKHRLEELERRVGDEDADAPQMHVEGGGQQEIVDEQFIEGFGQQKAHLTSQCFPSQELDAKSKGMTPRRGDRKKYYGGDSKDALFHGGVPNVPSGSIKKAAGGSDGDGDDGKEMGDGDGGGDSGGGDDGENSNEGATSTKTKRQAVVDLQQSMCPPLLHLGTIYITRAHADFIA